MGLLAPIRTVISPDDAALGVDDLLHETKPIATKLRTIDVSRRGMEDLEKGNELNTRQRLP
jgi:hypothetical protein